MSGGSRPRIGGLAWDDITGIQRVGVLDEGKAAHHLDLCDVPGAMSREVVLEVRLGSFQKVNPRFLSQPEGHPGPSPFRGMLPRYKRVLDTSLVFGGPSMIGSRFAEMRRISARSGESSLRVASGRMRNAR